MVNYLVGGIPTYPSEKWSFSNSWDDDIPNIWKKHVPNHRPAENLCFCLGIEYLKKHGMLEYHEILWMKHGEIMLFRGISYSDFTKWDT